LAGQNVALNRWIVIKEIPQHRYTLYNRGPRVRLDAAPIVIEPALDGFELLAFPGEFWRGCGNIAAGLGDGGKGM
jgi:hypothetical protein